MAVPKKKKSKSRCGHNNSHNAIKKLDLAIDSNGDYHVQHCATKLPDGSYRYKGRIISLKSNKDKTVATK